MAYEQQVNTKWNIDDDRMQTLSNYMKVCEIAMVNWDLEKIHLFLNAMRRMIIGAHTKEKEEKLTNGFKELEKLKRKLDLSKSDMEYHVNKSKYYNQADKIYTYINKLNISIGMYFRKGYDPTKAALEM